MAGIDLQGKLEYTIATRADWALTVLVDYQEGSLTCFDMADLFPARCGTSLQKPPPGSISASVSLALWTSCLGFPSGWSAAAYTSKYLAWIAFLCSAEEEGKVGDSHLLS